MYYVVLLLDYIFRISKLMIESNVIVVSAEYEIMIDKGSNDGVSEGGRVDIYSPDGTFKDQGDILIVHRKVSVIRGIGDSALNAEVGDLVKV
jgi:cell shape-determining protein MreC